MIQLLSLCAAIPNETEINISVIVIKCTYAECDDATIVTR